MAYSVDLRKKVVSFGSSGGMKKKAGQLFGVLMIGVHARIYQLIIVPVALRESLIGIFCAKMYA